MVRKLRSGDVDMGIVGYDMVREYGKVSISNFMCKHFEGSVFFLTQEKFQSQVWNRHYSLSDHAGDLPIKATCLWDHVFMHICLLYMGQEKKILCLFHVARMMKISLLFMMLLDMESATLQSE